MQAEHVVQKPQTGHVSGSLTNGYPSMSAGPHECHQLFVIPEVNAKSGAIMHHVHVQHEQIRPVDIIRTRALQSSTLPHAAKDPQ